MPHNKRRDTPARQWEQALIDAYYDFRHRELLEPLYQEFQRWKAGELSHADLHEPFIRSIGKTSASTPSS